MYKKGFPALLVCFLLGLLIINQGCSKDQLTTAPGLVINTGSFSNGGCEWIILVGLESFQPDNLPDEFKQNPTDSLPVEVTYRIVRRTADCPQPQNYSGLIHLNRIKRI